MGFQVSPGVEVKEIDLTNIVPAVSTTIGAIAGPFEKGPVEEIVAVSSEQDMVKVFGKPNNDNFEYWLTAANFLQYTNSLRIVRAASALTNASSNTDQLVSITPATATGGSPSVPTASISGGNPDVAATLGAVTFGIHSIAIGDSAGSGYSLNETVTLDLGTGTEATANVDSIDGSGAITGLTILTAGAYTALDSTVDEVTVTGVTSGASDATVDVTLSVVSVAITDGGDGYQSAPTVTFDGTGSFAQTGTASLATAILVKNDEDYEQNYADGQASVGPWTARTAGSWGNALGVSICDGADAFEKNLGASNAVDGQAAAGASTIDVDDGTAFQKGDIISFFDSSDTTYGTRLEGHESVQYEITLVASNTLTIRQLDDPTGTGLEAVVADDTLIRRRWRFYDLFSTGAPGTSTYASDIGVTKDELHIVVYDYTAALTGFDVDTAGQRTLAVVETFGNLSKHPNAKSPSGNSIYYKDVMARSSEFVYWMDHPAGHTDWGTVKTSRSEDTSYNDSVNSGLSVDSLLGGGADDYAVSIGELKAAYKLYEDSETVDVNLIMSGPAPAGTDGVAHALTIRGLCETRKDCVGYISPRRADVVGVPSSITQTDNVKEFFDQVPSSSYLVFDSGYKYMYDRFNDVYRYVPLNGDIAGLTAYTETIRDAWFSPAGYNRGIVRGAVKLAYNPNKAQRDILYPARINPVVTFPGQGTILFGDKTAQTKPSAFDRLNVRRLFIVLEKAIATAAKFQLFEFNDSFTQAQFRNLVEPFLRDIQGRRGITDFSVVCDETNNTGEVIDRNEFVADIFIKPARSINFITLNFIAVRTGVDFSEVGG